MLVGYDSSSDSSSESSNDEENILSKHDLLKLKFEELKKRHKQIKSGTPSDKVEGSTSKITTEENNLALEEVKSKRDPLRKKRRKETQEANHLEMCAKLTYQVVSEYDAHKRNKSNLELELDRACSGGKFQLAEKLSEEISLRNVEQNVQGAVEVRDYLKEQTKRERKRKVRWDAKKKRDWTLGARGRQGTKGSM